MKIDFEVQEFIVVADFDLLICQSQGEWKPKDLKIVPYKQCAKYLSKMFKFTEFRYIPRFLNDLTYVLATLVSMLPYPRNTCITPWEIQVREQHYDFNTIEAEPYGETWYLARDKEPSCR